VLAGAFGASATGGGVVGAGVASDDAGAGAGGGASSVFPHPLKNTLLANATTINTVNCFMEPLFLYKFMYH